MRAVVVVSNPNLPDIVYFSGDEGFCGEINEKARKNGWLPDESVSSHAKVDLHILLQYLQSLIASQQAMSSMLNCPYQSLLTENGSLVVIREYKEFLFIAINGDQTESKQFMLHRIFILQRIMEFFFGLNPERLGCGNDRGRQEEMWGNITKLLNTWESLYHTEQSFLMEAVERLNVNQFLNGLCIQLLEETLSSPGNKNRVHALLLVKGKLLALFSSPNAPELEPSSILMMTIIAESFYPSQKTLSEQDSSQFLKDVHAGLMGRKVGASQFYVAEDYAAAGEDNKSDNSSTSYYSPSQSSPQQSDQEDETKTPGEGSESLKSPPRKRRTSGLAESTDKYSTPRGDAHIKQVSQETSEETVFESDAGANEFYPSGFQLFVFLQQKYRKFLPHKLTFTPVLPGITMVVVSERRTSLGAHIVDALDLTLKLDLKKEEVLQRGPKHHLVNKLDDLVDKDIVGYLKTLVGDTKRTENQITDSLKKVKSALNKSSRQGSFQTEIEALCFQLTELFRNCFSQHRTLIQAIPVEVIGAHERCRSLAHGKLEYYVDYLAIKSEKNLTMAPYLDKYPGLVHFIHVDRSTNQLTAPSINVDYVPDNDDSKEDAHRNLVWSFIEKSRQFFQGEHTTVHFEIGDFQISSFLYFENSMGNISTPSNLPKMHREGFYPGLQAELHFRFITEHGYQGFSDHAKCCELHCIHLAVVPLKVVAQQVRKLRERLWEASSVAAPAINLL